MLNKVYITISLYIGGLYNEIGLLLRMFKPRSLTDTYSLATIQESILASSKTRYTSLLPTPKMHANVHNNRKYKHAPYSAKTTSLALQDYVHGNLNGASSSRTDPQYVNPRKRLT